ncbi:MoaD/ThiS family protein [Dokdonella sp.]|uniref:MoaD/ThiS family protein n=1 Tax=Dokdonella sp. TaxID=2291710 RepID=UPI001B021CA7|nr:MoaD/ThiS family protein [Dokdonella sp.]MBO9664967.1 MoaD/ThiS family protein [Dokdonella sp.]
MAKIVLAPALARWLQDSPSTHHVETATTAQAQRLDAALEHLFAQHPRLRGYVLDEHGAVRHHVAIFVDGTAIRDKRHLQQPLAADSEVYVMQALSGG